MSQPWSPSGDMEPRRAAPGAHGSGPRVAAGSGTAAELVYHLAGALGAELQELARRFGPEAAAGLVPLVVQALELLEKAAVGPAPDSVSHGALPQPPAWASGGWPNSAAFPAAGIRTAGGTRAAAAARGERAPPQRAALWTTG